MCDVITIGSATMDVFVESDDANIVSVYTKNKKSEFMSYPYGAKVEITDFASQVGGGGVNTAMNFYNLGLSTSAIFKIGDDIYSDGVLESFKGKDIDLKNIIQDPKISTGFSIILVSFQGDRTVLAHRGANAKIKKSDINFDAIKNAKLLYIAPMNGDSTKVLDDIAAFANENNVYVCFNAGSTSIKKDLITSKRFLKTPILLFWIKKKPLLPLKLKSDQTQEMLNILMSLFTLT